MERRAEGTQRAPSTVVDGGEVRFGHDPFPVIAGPCAVEEPDPGAWPRPAPWPTGEARCCGAAPSTSGSSPYSFPGLGLAGLELLACRGTEVGLPVATSVASPSDVERCRPGLTCSRSARGTCRTSSCSAPWVVPASRCCSAGALRQRSTSGCGRPSTCWPRATTKSCWSSAGSAPSARAGWTRSTSAPSRWSRSAATCRCLWTRAMPPAAETGWPPLALAPRRPGRTGSSSRSTPSRTTPAPMAPASSTPPAFRALMDVARGQPDAQGGRPGGPRDRPTSRRAPPPLSGHREGQGSTTDAGLRPGSRGRAARHHPGRGRAPRDRPRPHRASLRVILEESREPRSAGVVRQPRGDQLPFCPPNQARLSRQSTQSRTMTRPSGSVRSKPSVIWPDAGGDQVVAGLDAPHICAGGALDLGRIAPDLRAPPVEHPVLVPQRVGVAEPVPDVGMLARRAVASSSRRHRRS